MSVDSPPGLPSDVAALLARADAAGRGAERYLAATIDDLFLPDEYRLDDRTRARLGLLLRSTIVAIGADLHARCWAQRGAAPGKSFDAAPLIARLAASDALRDPELIGELLDRTRQDLLGEALRANRPPGAQMPLLSRLVEGRDQAVAAAAWVAAPWAVVVAVVVAMAYGLAAGRASLPRRARGSPRCSRRLARCPPPWSPLRSRPSAHRPPVAQARPRRPGARAAVSIGRLFPRPQSSQHSSQPRCPLPTSPRPLIARPDLRAVVAVAAACLPPRLTRSCRAPCWVYPRGFLHVRRLAALTTTA